MTTLHELADRLRRGTVTSVELAEAALTGAGSDTCGAFTRLTADLALQAARTADRELAAGRDRGVLHGIPVAVKDVIDVAGIATGNGAAEFAGRMPQQDAAVWSALRDAGAVLVGKTRTSALALSMLTPGCTNPHDPTRTCGGSSGGSAAAVAAGIVPVALGTDTSGSIRIPAALTGVAGIRPTHRLLSYDGVSALCPPQDTVGVLAGTPTDCLLTLDVLRRGAGRGPLADGSPADGDGGRGLDHPVRIAVHRLWGGPIQPAVAEELEDLCRDLRAEFNVRECTLDLAGLSPALSYQLTAYEAARLWGGAAVPASVADDLAYGATLAAEDYRGATALAGRVRQALCEVFATQADVVLLPTTAATAVPVGADSLDLGDGRSTPVSSAYGRFTALASVCGVPAMSVRCGVDPLGLPIGVQLVGPPRSEARLCRVGEWVARRARTEATAS